LAYYSLLSQGLVNPKRLLFLWFSGPSIFVELGMSRRAFVCPAWVQTLLSRPFPCFYSLHSYCCGRKTAITIHPSRVAELVQVQEVDRLLVHVHPRDVARTWRRNPHTRVWAGRLLSLTHPNSTTPVWDLATTPSINPPATILGRAADSSGRRIKGRRPFLSSPPVSPRWSDGGRWCGPPLKVYSLPRL